MLSRVWQATMAKEGPNWDGLLKWSLAHSDGTQPPRNLRYLSSSRPLFFFFWDFFHWV